MVKIDSLKKEDNPIWRQSKRRHREHGTQSEHSSTIFVDQKLSLHDIEFPKCLVDLLIADRDLVTKKHYLQKLPNATTVTKTLSQFEEYVLLKLEHKRYEIAEFVECLDDFFNIILPKSILYRFERRQYSDFLKKFQACYNDKIKYSLYYGPLCLLRMVFKLQNYVHDAYGKKVPENADLIYLKLKNFIQMLVMCLAENKEKIFVLSEMYELASENYIEESRFN